MPVVGTCVAKSIINYIQSRQVRHRVGLVFLKVEFVEQTGSAEVEDSGCDIACY